MEKTKGPGARRIYIRCEQQAAACLADSLIVLRLFSPQATSYETEPQAEQHGCKDRAKDGGLNDGHEIPLVREQDEEHDDLDDGAEPAGI